MKLTCKACLLGLLLPVVLNGQETGLLRLDPDRPARQGEAALWGGIEEGGYKPTYAGDFQWSAGADADFTRHGKTASWTGALSFKQTIGHHMASSMFLEPERYPFDVLEFVEGAKPRQDVRLDLGFLADIGYEWAIGLKAAAKGAYVSKRQTVRHSSLGIDVHLEPVLTYVMDDDMGLVSAYKVNYRTETLQAEEDAGDLFLDQGMRYGTYQALGGNGVFPVQEFTHGLSELLHSPEFSAGLEVLWKRGWAGGPSCERFTFPGDALSAFFRHTILSDKADHVYGASYSRERDWFLQAADGDAISLSGRNHRRAELTYEARFLDGILKKTGITLDGNYWIERYLAEPRDQNQRFDGTAKVHATFSSRLVDLEVSFLGGDGWLKNPGTDGQVSDSRPEQLAEDWLRKMDYFLTRRIGLGGTLTGRLPFVKGMYLQLHGYWYHAFDATLLPGNDREIATLKVGYQF